MAIDASASDVKPLAGALSPAPSTNAEPAGAPAPSPDPEREEKLIIFERGFKALWPTPDPKHYAYTDVQRYAMSFLHGARDLSDDAQDVVQTAFVALWESWFLDVPPKPFPTNHEEFRAIVFATVRQRALNRRRDESQLKRWLGKVYRERPARAERWIFGYPDAHPFLDAVVDASQALPGDTRQVFLLKWQHGYKRQEIADILQVKLNRVDSHLEDANVRLMGLVADYRSEIDENWIVATRRLEEIAYPEFSINARARERRMSGDMTPKRLTGVMGPMWADPDKKKKRKSDANDPSEFSRHDMDHLLGFAEPLTAGGVIALHRPVLPSPLGFLADVVGLLLALPDLYRLSVRAEDLEARLAYALAPYLAGEATDKWAEIVEQQLLTHPDAVEMAGPLLALWQLSPARTRDAEVDVAWAEFQRRVGLSSAPPPQSAIDRINAVASKRGEFTVTHPRSKMWWGRLGGIALMVLGGLSLVQAGIGFAASGNSPTVAGAADGGFAFILSGVAMIQTSRVQVIRRSRAVLFMMVAAVIALTMDVISLRGGWG